VDHIGVKINGGGFKGVRVDEGDAVVSKQGGVPWGLWKVVVIGAGAHGFEEGEARDGELKQEFGAGGNGGQPGDNRGRCGAGGILEAGASGTWVIPSVVGTVEDVVNDLKGGSRVLLVDGIQVRPRGDGEGRGGHFQTVSFYFKRLF